MRVAALYDIHGNLPALEAVLEDVQRAGVERIVIGGDVVPGPMPSESLERVLTLSPEPLCIRGNGEREVLAKREGRETGTVPEAFREVIRWVAEQLAPHHANAIGDWPATRRLEIAGIGPVSFCHATPRNDTDVFTRRTDERGLIPMFAEVDAPLVVCGHTHMQFDRLVGRTRVVNAGSVGMPFGEPGAYWLLLGPGVELRRTEYDLARAAERVRATAYPQADHFAEHNILRPPSEDVILERFAHAEVKVD